MPFNSQIFKTRTLTAIVFVAIMLAGLLINQWTFLGLFIIIHIGSWVEYNKLIALIHPPFSQTSSFYRNGFILLGIGCICYATNGYFKIGNIYLNAIGWYTLMILTIMLLCFEVVLKKELNLASILYSVLGLIYISLSISAMISLRTGVLFISKEPFTSIRNYINHPTPSIQNLGFMLPILVIVSIWINDTMAYIVGSLIGRTPLSKISPKKTYEGTVGGALLAILTVTLTSSYLLHFTLQIGLGISVIAAIAGNLGDLLESKLKRLAGVKDSGSIMPGHGGFLDRFDSLLLTLPFIWLYFKFFPIAG